MTGDPWFSVSSLSLGLIKTVAIYLVCISNLIGVVKIELHGFLSPKFSFNKKAVCIKSSCNSLWWHIFAILIPWNGIEDSFLMSTLCGWTLFNLSQSGGIISSNFEMKKGVNQRYLTLAHTDVMSSSDSFFEDQKDINSFLDIVIGVQSYYNSYIFYYIFCFVSMLLDFDSILKMSKEFQKWKRVC